MSKKRWDKPNEALWMTVFVISFFLLSADSAIVLLIALAMMGLAGYKLRDMDLEDECV